MPSNHTQSTWQRRHLPNAHNALTAASCRVSMQPKQAALPVLQAGACGDGQLERQGILLEGCAGHAQGGLQLQRGRVCKAQEDCQLERDGPVK